MAKSNPVARIRAAALLDLEKRNRRLLPEDVVAAAADPKHVLHDYFEWDDSEAARLYRLDQARALIREVKVTIVTNDLKIVCPVYVSDPDPDRKNNAYVALTTISKREDDAQRVLLDEFSRIEGALKRAKAVAAVLDLLDDLEAMAAALIGVRERVIKRKAPPDNRPQPTA